MQGRDSHSNVTDPFFARQLLPLAPQHRGPRLGANGQLVAGLAFVLVLVTFMAWLVGGSSHAAAPSPQSIDGAGSPTATPTACVTQPLVEGFESGAIGTYFTSSAPLCEWQFGECEWTATTDAQFMGSYSAWTPAFADVTDVRLTTSNAIEIPASVAQATLEFWHSQAFEGGDGGVLETSTDGGASWQDAGANIIQGNYDTTLGGPGHPFAGRQGWGDYFFGAWGQVRVSLLSYAGHDLLFRFRLGTNNNGGTDGWYIDDIVVRITAACVTGTPPTRTSTATPTITPTAVPTCIGDWTRVNSPSPNEIRSHLYDVEVIAPDDIWAVGQYNTTFGIDETLILHWDGTTWSQVSGTGTENSGLFAVSAVASDDVWAVGYYIPDEFGIFQPLTIHWNGTAWNVITSPANPAFETVLHGVGAAATNDVWAVGENEDGPMIMHWDGTEWSITPHPLQRATFHEVSLYYDSLYAVEVLSASDVWAVGAIGDQSLALHWNGTAWTVAGTPNPYDTVILRGIDAISANNIWAVGSTDYFMEDPRPVTLHWDGQDWTNVSAPTDDFVLNDVAALSSNEIWAVGYEQVDEFTTNALFLHRSGTQWTRVPSPNPAPENQEELDGIAASSSAEAWAVGIYDGATLVDRYVNACATPTPGTTSTPTPTEAIPSPTPTACLVQFTDVLPGSTFYPFVRCMACLGIIEGYTSGCETGNPCYRPGNNVTRGQLAKIVSNSAGFIDPPGSQLYQDVPPGSTFYSFIQRLAIRDIVSGYPCGGPGEPCLPPGNLPYFRPNSNATRGQISKIVAITAGWTDPTGNQTFEDVTPGSTFHLWIENLAAHGVMQGYTCGNPEPCVPPGNRPYFRPQNNATRGQTAKIVTNTFFPACNPPRAR